MQEMTDRKGFLAAAATAAGATGVIASQGPANASPTRRNTIVFLRAVVPDEFADIEWHLNNGFSLQGFTLDTGNAPWVCLLRVL